MFLEHGTSGLTASLDRYLLRAGPFVETYRNTARYRKEGERKPGRR